MKLGTRLSTTVAVALISVGSLTGCGTSGGSSGTNAGAGIAQQTRSLPSPQILTAAPNAAQVEYRVGPRDLLEISVFQVPDLSKSVNVNARGTISMPLIGEVQAAGKTVAELEDEIATKLEAKYMQSPQVSVFVKEANSQTVTVEGAVGNPGMVALNGPTTLLQTIAMSGGLVKGADAGGILVFRTVDQKRAAAKFDLKAIRAGKAEDPLLAGGDIVVVDTTAMAGLLDKIPVFGLFTALGSMAL